MTTAHRPTWHNALGGENQGGNRLIPTQKVSSRDQPGNLTLKQRKPEQGPQTTNKKKLQQQLEAKEKQAAAARRKLASNLSALPAEHYVNPFPEDADDGDFRPTPALLGTSSSNRRGNKEGRSGGAAAADGGGGDREGSSSEDLSDDESDEEQELLRELEKIKQERREEERARRAAEEKKKEAEQKERMLRANPLLLDPDLAGGGEPGHSGGVKRRWDDEVVFKNQAKNLPKAKKQFINDPVRSEFHRKFLSKYIV